MPRLLLLTALLLSACGSPTSPTPELPFFPPETAQFTVVVVDNHLNPMPGAVVTLELNGGALASRGLLSQVTRADGSATWHVRTGASYAVITEDRRFFGTTPVVGDNRWVAVIRPLIRSHIPGSNALH